MRKISILFTAALAAIAVVSCDKKANKPETAPANFTEVEIYAEVVTPDTKTTITPGEDVFTCSWEEGDVITFDYTAPDGTTGNVQATYSSGRFTASLPEATGAWKYSNIFAHSTDNILYLGGSRVQTGDAIMSRYDGLFVASADEPSYTSAAAGCDESGNPIVFQMTRPTAVLYYHLTSENTSAVKYAILSTEEGVIASESVTIENDELVLAEGKSLNSILLTPSEVNAADATLWFNVIPCSYSNLKLTLVDVDGKVATLTKKSAGSYAAGKLYKASKSIEWAAPVVPEGLTENFSSSKATSNQYDCSTYLTTAANRSDFDYVWSCDKGSVFKNGIKLGSSSATGYVSNTSILSNVNADVEFTVYVYAAAWNTDINTLDVTYNGEKKSATPANPAITSTSDVYSPADFVFANSFTFTKVAGVDELKIASSAKRIIIDKVIVAYTQTEKEAQTLSFPQAAYSARMGESFTAPVLSGAQTAVTYSSSNTAAATVDASTGAITLVAPGTTTITATAAETAAYRAGSASYTLTVVAGVVSLPYSEAFSTGLGNCTIENVTLPSALSYVWKLDSTNKCMKASAYVSSTNYEANSQIVTPTLDLTSVSGAVLTFDVASRYGDKTKYGEVFYVNVYDGTNWTKHSVSNFSDGTSWTFLSNSIDLTSYCGKQIKIALVYNSVGQTSAPTLEVKNLSVMSGSTELTAEDQTIAYGSTSKSIIYTTNSTGAVTYSSSNTKVVTVASDGKITTTGVGEATVTVKVAATDTNPAASATCKITVTKGYNPASFAVYNVHIYESGQFQADCALGVTGESFTGQTLAGASNYRSDCEFFTVATDGTVSGFKSIGSAQTETGTITADLAETELYEARTVSYIVTIHYFKFDLGIDPKTVAFHAPGGTADVSLAWTNFHANNRVEPTVTYSSTVPSGLTCTFSDNYETMTITCPELDGSEWSTTVTVTVTGRDIVMGTTRGTASATFTLSQDNKSNRVLKTYTMEFVPDNMESTNSYQNNWTATSGTFSLNMTNWNNYSNAWNFVKAGSKNYALVGAITTASPIAEDIERVIVSIAGITSSNVNSIKLYVASDESFTTNVQTISVDVPSQSGDVTFNIPNPALNSYYKLEFDCKKSSNGVVWVSKVIFTNEE